MNHMPKLPFIAICLTVGTLANGPVGRTSTQGVQILWNQNGLASIVFGSHNYLSFGQLNVSRLEMTNAQGRLTSGLTNGTPSVDAANHMMSLAFPWGAIQSQVTAAGNAVNIRLTISNASKENITGLSLEPMRLQFDQKPSQYDGSIPILGDNISAPAVLALSTMDESVILSDNNPSKPLSLGFPWAINKPASTEFPIRLVTGREPMYPDKTPLIDRPILAGGTDVYDISLTFGNPNDKDLALSVYRQLARLYPPTYKWTDRRPIGAIMLATAAAGFPGNPRGWFLDRSLDLSAKQGESRFRHELMKWADMSVSILHKMNAQGAITWDIEGEQFQHPSTYVGDPRLIDSLDPEMSSCVDEYFKRFRDAGLRVGITIRPQHFVRSADGLRATQEPVADPTQLLEDKISYAKKRWGATLFYVDSNGDPNYPLDASILRAVSIHNPDVLLIPEHSSLLYYAFSAPYGELRRGVIGSMPLARSIFPDAFRVINTADGDPGGRLFPQIQDAVREGDILMFRTWFQDPANDVVHSLVTNIRTSSRESH